MLVNLKNKIISTTGIRWALHSRYCASSTQRCSRAVHARLHGSVPRAISQTRTICPRDLVSAASCQVCKAACTCILLRFQGCACRDELKDL